MPAEVETMLQCSQANSQHASCFERGVVMLQEELPALGLPA